MQILIDGKEVTIERQRNPQLGWEKVYVWGEDVNGRPCRIGEHTLPVQWLDHGDTAVITGGHTYSKINK